MFPGIPQSVGSNATLVVQAAMYEPPHNTFSAAGLRPERCGI